MTGSMVLQTGGLDSKSQIHPFLVCRNKPDTHLQESSTKEKSGLEPGGLKLKFFML